MPKRSSPWPQSGTEWLVWGGLAMLALVARLIRLGSDSFWLDEAASWWFASRPLAEQWSQIPFYEPHPPLYYTLLWLWSLVFGESEAGLRSLSAVASVLTVPVIYGIARMSLRGDEGRSLAAFAGLIAALFPSQIQFAQETRAYALLMLSASLVLAALIWLMRHGERLHEPPGNLLRHRESGVRGALITLIVATALSFWFHNASLVLVTAMLAVAVLLIGRESGYSARQFVNYFFIGLVILILWSPNLIWLIDNVTQVTGGFWLQRPNWFDITYTADLLYGSHGIAMSIAAKAVATIPLMGLGCTGGIALWRRGERLIAGFLLTAAFMPFLLDILVSYLVTPIFLHRVMVWVEAGFIVLLAANLLWLRSLAARRVAAATIGIFLGALVLFGYGRMYKEPWREVADIVVREAGPNDLIIVDTAYAQVPMLYYRLRERSSARWMAVPDEYPLPMGPNGYPDGFFLRTQIDDAMRERIRAAAQASRRVWHVTRGKTVYDWDQTIAATLRSVHPQVNERVYSLQTLLLTEYE